MTESPRWLRIAAVPLMLAAGAMVSMQSHLNGELAVELGTGARAGFGAAAISFGSGLILVGIITAALPSGRRGVGNLRTALTTGRLRPAEMIGGAFGAFLVATQGLTVGTIGVALFSIAVTAGQSSSALLVDHVGLGPSGHQPLSIPRFIAATFAVVAVILAAGERLAAAVGWQTAVFAILALLAGAGTAIQQAINGRVSAVGGPWATTLNNFIVGTTVLLACLALSTLAHGQFAEHFPREPALYTGGVMGVAFIWLAAVLVKVHGVLVLGLAMIAGNVMGAEAIELVGGDAHIGWLGILAGALTILGVLIAVLMRPRSPISTR
ncbi:MAG TPA: DMT family transporter [Aeromicrobium sp.]|nr:DMT family transporter [Aeromicrobium sp.]